MANEYLKRTPTSNGNRKKWTLAGWLKINKNFESTYNTVWSISAGTSGDNSDRFHLYHYSNGRWASTGTSSFSAVFTGPGGSAAHSRDPGAWMHVCLSCDTTISSLTPDKIQRFWVNGIEYIYDDAGNIGANSNLAINGPYEHHIGTRLNSGNPSRSYNGQMFDLYLVDGQALTPDVFGFYKDGDGYQSSGTSNVTDFRPGQWMPHTPRVIKKSIERSGGFGVNGYYLPMNDSSNPGADFHMTPNSIITLKGEDLPQPRNGAPTTSDAFVSQLRQETGTLGFDGVVKFDGDGDYLSITDHDDLDLGTGDFTIEFFAYATSSEIHDGYISKRTTGSFTTNNQWRIAYNDANNNINLIHADNTSVTAAAAPAPGPNWAHYAFTRQSGTLRVFRNGVKTSEASGWTYDFSNAYNLLIGANVTSSNYFDGFLSNVRIIKGTALYTANFTAPTEPLTNVTNTTLLCCNSSTSAIAATVKPGDITANGAFATRNELTGSIVLAVPGIAGGQGSGYGDYSADIRGSGTNKTIAANGNATVASVASYYGSAMTFDGTGDHFRTTTNLSDFQFGTDDFTIEGWIFKSADGNDQYDGLIALGQNGSAADGWFLEASDTRGILFAIGSNFVQYDIDVNKSQWQHVAVERHNGTTTIYYNGIASASATTLGSPATTGTVLDIGAYGLDGTSGEYYFNGNIQDVRIYKGVAKYKGGFDVPKSYTPVGIEKFRTTADNCKNNFATWNSVLGKGRQDQLTYSEGNLKVVSGATGGFDTTSASTIAIKGKIYCEFALPSDAEGAYTGVMKYDTALTNNGIDTSGTSDVWLMRGDNGNKVNGSGSSYGGAFSDGDIIMMAVDIDNSSIWWGRNGSWNASGDPAANSNAAYTNLPSTEDLLAICGDNYSSKTPHIIANFGQNPTFGNLFALNKNRANNGTGDNVWHQSSNGGTHTDWTVSAGGTQLDVTVPSGHYARVYLLASDGTIDPKKTYLFSFKYTTGPSNLGINDDQGYMTAVDGSTAPSGLSSGNFYSFVIHGDSQVFITAFQGSTYRLENIIVSEIDECYTDDSGKGKFHYQPPTGFLALCEDNLPTPAIADPGDHFKTVLYSGDNSAGRRISDVGFQPDMVWIKARNATPSHVLTDSVRGIGHQLSPDDAGVEVDSGTLYLTGFADNGFDLSDGANSGGNTTGRNYVAWCWKAGGAAVTNNDGSRTTQVSVNQTAGFSIGTFTGDVANTHTIGHGLGKVPSVIIVKERTGNSGWAVYHKSRGSTKVSYLNAPDSEYTETGDTSSWNATDPTSSVFSVGKNGATNDNTLVFYAWAEIEGFSKFGSYTGNANADGPFVYCGFKPAFVMTKRTDSTSNWIILDSSRGPTNPDLGWLYANLSYYEEDGSGRHVDFLSNGFKLRTAGTDINASGTYIFMAFAESPFQTANAK